MSKIALDLKKFKHIKSDDSCTTLEHQDGHVLTVAHKALSPEFQKQLTALSKSAKHSKEEPEIKMSEGGDVKYERLDPDKAAKAQKGIQENKLPSISEAFDNIKKELLGKTKGGEVQKYAEGDIVEQPVAQDQATAVEEQPSPYAETYNKIYSQQKILNPGLPDNMVRQQAMSVAEIQQDKDTSSARNLVEDQQMQHNAAIQENQRRATIGLPPLPVPAQPNIAPPPPASNMPVSEAASIDQPDQGLAAKPEQPAATVSHDPETMLGAGFSQRIAGINQQAEAAGQLGEQQAKMLDEGIQAQNQAKDTYKSIYQQLEDERQAHMQDIKDGYIDPNQYWTGDKNGNGGHSKIASAIGMILGGFNPTNSPNAAVNFLKFQMEQNLNAQRENLGAKQNLLTANLRQFGNARDAMDMTRLMQNDIMTHELQSAAAKAQTPMAKAAALQAAGQLQMEAAPMFQQFAMRRAMMNLADGGGSPQSIDHMLGYMRVMNPEMAKEMESRYVPGVGLASTPLDASVRKEITAKNQLAAAGKDLLKYSQTHTNIVPGTKEYTYGVSKALAFQQMVREGLLGTVFRESEKPLLEKFVKENPAGAFKAFKTQPQLKAILDSNDMALNSIKQSYGLPVRQEQASPQIKTVNGIKYMRGPNGEAIRVK